MGHLPPHGEKSSFHRVDVFKHFFHNLLTGGIEILASILSCGTLFHLDTQCQHFFLCLPHVLLHGLHALRLLLSPMRVERNAMLRLVQPACVVAHLLTHVAEGELVLLHLRGQLDVVCLELHACM